MSSSTRYAILTGSIGAIVNVLLSAAFGVCGPVLALVIGAISGFLATQTEEPPSKAAGGRAGAIAGAISGGLMVIGQVSGSAISLFLFQSTSLQPPLGAVPAPTDPMAFNLMYYISGLGVGLCFGIADVVGATIAGGLTGYLNSADKSPRVVS